MTRSRSRRSPRWRHHDYGRAGWYFVTVCTADRTCLFGEVADASVRLSPLGRIAAAEWIHTTRLRPNVCLDAFVVMPNHLHGLIGLTDAPPFEDDDTRDDHRRDTRPRVPTPGSPAPLPEHRAPSGQGVPASDVSGPSRRRVFGGSRAGTLSSVVGAYKAAVTRRARQDLGWDGPVWQTRFHDRVVRSDAERLRIRTYIQQNPLRWHLDQLYR